MEGDLHELRASAQPWFPSEAHASWVTVDDASFCWVVTPGDLHDAEEDYLQAGRQKRGGRKLALVKVAALEELLGALKLSGKAAGRRFSERGEKEKEEQADEGTR